MEEKEGMRKMDEGSTIQEAKFDVSKITKQPNSANGCE